MVVACDPGREFACAVGGPGGMTANTWRYQLEPSAGGTAATESFELPDTPLTRLYWAVGARSRQPGRHAGHPGEDQGGHRIGRFFPVGPTPMLPASPLALNALK
jgi:hypothetical protein